MKKIFAMLMVAMMSLAFAATPKADVKQFISLVCAGKTDAAAASVTDASAFRENFMEYSDAILADGKKLMAKATALQATGDLNGTAELMSQAQVFQNQCNEFAQAIEPAYTAKLITQSDVEKIAADFTAFGSSAN